MASEADIIERESGGNPYVGYGGVDLSKAPRDKYGFPIWEGKMGPAGISHAAGLHQWEPKTWGEAAQALGLTDFSEASQHQAFNYMHAKYGDKPWAASEPLKPGEHRWVGAPQQTDQGLQLGTLEKNFAQPQEPPPGMFLDALLKPKDAAPSPEMEPPGSRSLDSLLSGAAPEPPGGQVLDKLLTAPATPSVPVAPPPAPTAPAPEVQTPPIGNHFLDGLLSGASTGLAERPSGAPPNVTNGTSRTNVPTNGGQIPQQPTPAQGGDVLDRLLTQVGTVPPRETDTELAQHMAQHPESEPLIDVGKGGELTGRLPEMAEALTPYILGAAPAGTASAGMRLPGRIELGGLPAHIEGLPARIEPPPLAEGGGAGLPPPGNRAVGPVEGGPPEPPSRIDTNETVNPPRPPRDYSSPREGKPERTLRKNAISGVEDRLDKITLANEADRIATYKFFKDGLPRSYDANAKLRIEHYLEGDDGPGVVPPSEADLKLINNVIKPSQLRSAAMYRKLAGEGFAQELDDEGLTEGYLHRIVVGKSGGVPRVGGGENVMDPFSRTRGLRRSTSSMNQRAEGLRGKSMREIEQETDIRYVHDPLFATLSNEMRLHQVTRNVDALNEMMPRLEAASQAIKSAERPASGWQQSKIPSLRGWWFQPAPRGKAGIVDAFDDFYQRAKVVNLGEGRLAAAVEAANHYATASLFFDPRAHMWNRANDFWMARGWDSVWPASYARMGRAMMRAGRDVTQLNQNYLTALRNGLSLRRGDIASRNFWDTMVQKAGSEMRDWKDIAQTLGVNPVGALFRFMQHGMWSFDDMLQLGRVYELMESKGLGMESAIQQLKRDMPPYRIPTEVMGSRTASRLLQDRSLAVFNQYHYAKLKQVANAIRDVVRGTAEERKEAAGRLFALAVMAGVVVPMASVALRYLTGDPNARFRQGGVSGLAAAPFQIGGALAQKGWTGAQEEMARTLSSLMTPAPATEEAAEQFFNTDFFTRKPISGEGVNPGVALAERGYHAAMRLEPLRDIDQLWTGRGHGGLPWWTAIGGTTQTPEQQAIQQYFEQRGYRSGQRDWSRFLQQHGLPQ